MNSFNIVEIIHNNFYVKIIIAGKHCNLKKHLIRCKLLSNLVFNIYIEWNDVYTDTGACFLNLCLCDSTYNKALESRLHHPDDIIW